jgi:hypothetical protein
MDNLNSTEAAKANEEATTQKEAKKRIPYVQKDLKSMIEVGSKIYNQLGHTTYHSNKAIAIVIGLSPDSIKQHLSAAQQYKILELKHGIGYKITDHFQKLFLPKNENEERLAVIESLKNPETYEQLFKDYEYHTVPTEGVKNYFIRNYDQKEGQALKLTQIFIDNLKDYDLLDSRGVLTSGLPSKPIVPEVKTEVDEQAPSGNNGSQDDNDSERNMLPIIKNTGAKVIFQTELDAAGKKTVPIYLTDSKQAMLVYPDDITEDDIELVKHQIEGVLLRIKLESKKRPEN